MAKKIIEDVVHGVIEIDEDIQLVIDTRSFQRLKSIAQLTAQHLFPSSNHTRFEHSIGVMYLSIRIFNQLKKSRKMDSIVDIKNIELHLKYAALLHDIGHAPLSHVGEQFYSEKEIVKEINDSIKNTIFINKNISGAKHEIMSCLIILKYYKNLLEKIFSKHGVALDLDLIFRVITGNNYSDSKGNNWLKNLIISIVNSSSFDSDKLDYLIRDNFYCGNVAPQIDVERLILSMIIDNENKIAFTSKGIPSIISFIDCRDFLYLWVYNHHMVIYTDFLYSHVISYMINNSGKSKVKMIWNKYFSTDAIASHYISDNEVIAKINEEYLRGKGYHTEILLRQLLDREMLKPLWKNIYEFKQFMGISFDARQGKRIIKDINDKIQGYKYITNIVKSVIAKTDYDFGSILLVKRSNKFYSMNEEAKFYIYSEKEGDTDINEIIPTRNFKEKYNEIAFFVYTREEQKDRVKAELINILKERKNYE